MPDVSGVLQRRFPVLSEFGIAAPPGMGLLFWTLQASIATCALRACCQVFSVPPLAVLVRAAGERELGLQPCPVQAGRAGPPDRLTARRATRAAWPCLCPAAVCGACDESTGVLWPPRCRPLPADGTTAASGAVPAGRTAVTANGSSVCKRAFQQRRTALRGDACQALSSPGGTLR